MRSIVLLFKPLRIHWILWWNVNRRQTRADAFTRTHPDLWNIVTEFNQKAANLPLTLPLKSSLTHLKMKLHETTVRNRHRFVAEVWARPSEPGVGSLSCWWWWWGELKWLLHILCELLTLTGYSVTVQYSWTCQAPVWFSTSWFGPLALNWSGSASAAAPSAL